MVMELEHNMAKVFPRRSPRVWGAWPQAGNVHTTHALVYDPEEF
jgi:hypothetical protein